MYFYAKYKNMEFNYNTFQFFLSLSTIIILLSIFYNILYKRKIFKNIKNLIHLIKKTIINTSLKQFLICFLMSLCANLFAALIFLIILSGFGINKINFDGLMAFEAAYFTTSLLPITPSGIGVREGSRVYFYSLIGCSQAAVLSTSFITFALNIALPALIGITSLKHLLSNKSEYL
jgi:uncharacterized protein (TIRG00374 family)